MKSQIDNALLMLDDFQLNSTECDSPAYGAISSIKELLEKGGDLIKGRFDLIQKVDSSKVGWSAAPFYEKINGYLVTPESGKNWETAERKALESRKAEEKDKSKAPFRSQPVGNGRYQNFAKPKGEIPFYDIGFSSYLLCWG